MKRIQLGKNKILIRNRRSHNISGVQVKKLMWNKKDLKNLSGDISWKF